MGNFVVQYTNNGQIYQIMREFPESKTPTFYKSAFFDIDKIFLFSSNANYGFPTEYIERFKCAFFAEAA